MPALPLNIAQFAIQAYRIPSITAYNRLEVMPRTVDFDRSLKAEVHDALWMLTRQWQFGEFQGEDAATATSTKIYGLHTLMDEMRFQGDQVLPYDGKIPLEAMVEREKLAGNLHLAVQMARYFIKLIKTKPGFDAAMVTLVQHYPLNYAIDENDYEGIQLMNAVKGSVFDGFAFCQAISGNTLPGNFKTTYLTQLGSFQSWYQRTYSQPDKNGSPWMPSQLDYKFEVSNAAGTTERKLIADHYSEGHLDWYSFDISDPSNSDNVAKEDFQSYIPAPVAFKGMPHPRFWMMEENRTDFGKIDASPTGLLHLLLAEFALTCSNDWFVLPYQLPVNTLCEVSGIVVKDVFGEYTLVRPANKGPESQWQRWAMFHHTDINNTAASNKNLLYLAPAVIKTLEGDPLEKVNFLRDEMANMVWAVENIVPSQAGKGMRGNEMALEKSNAVATAPSTEGDGVEKTSIRYVLGTAVPHNWIPFIPVHLDQNNAEIQLQRAKLPFSKGAIGQIVKEKAAPYYIAEEVIPRSGVQVTRNFQLARTADGACCLWLGRKKQSGSGEGQSNLKFDQIVDG
ncbi:MAG: hypothetical protein ABIS36_23315 [Chryseolinea sp.]